MGRKISQKDEILVSHLEYLLDTLIITLSHTMNLVEKNHFNGHAQLCSDHSGDFTRNFSHVCVGVYRMFLWLFSDSFSFVGPVGASYIFVISQRAQINKYKYLVSFKCLLNKCIKIEVQILEWEIRVICNLETQKYISYETIGASRY